MKGEQVGGVAISAWMPQGRASSGLGPDLAQTRREFVTVVADCSPCVGAKRSSAPVGHKRTMKRHELILRLVCNGANFYANDAITLYCCPLAVDGPER